MTDRERFTTVDDPGLPCPYCCSWDEDPDQFEYWPIMPDGTPIPTIYSGTHPHCQQMVDDYMAEQRAEREARGGFDD